MTKEELIKSLQRLSANGGCDPESDHGEADELLLDYIDDPDVRSAFNEIEKWYA